MYVQPNTPTLPFEPNTPVPTGPELIAVTAYFVDSARVCDGDGDVTASMLTQAAASLVLVQFFTGPAARSREARGLRRNVRQQRRWLGLVGPFLLALSLFFVGCGDPDGIPSELPAGDDDDDDAGGELSTPTCEEPSEPIDVAPADIECGALHSNLFGQDLRQLRGPACPGLALGSRGGDTRIVVDARTQLCTFPCEVQEVTGDPACHDAHAAHVSAFCASLGGTCVAEGDAPPRCIYWREVGR